MRSLPLVGLAGSIIFGAFGAMPAPAQTAAPPSDGRGVVAAAPQNAARPLYGGSAAQVAANGAPIVLEVNKGTLIRLTAPAATVFIANPDIADVQVKSPTLIYVSAKSPGETVLYAVDASDAVLLNSPVRVEHDLSRLRSSLRIVAPGERISAESVDGNLVLSGIAADAGSAEKAQKLAASIAGETKGAVINRMTVATPNQVSIHVRIAEVSLTALSAIGVNWHKLGSNVIINTNNPTAIMGTIGSNEIIIGRIASQAISATVDALAQEGFVKDLAEPDLVALNGQTASFLAGGEFPVPISGSSSGTNGFPTITVEFKSFGVSLAFTPTIIDAHHLDLRVRPEVSALTSVGAVSVPITSTATVTIPALTVRRAETSVELGSGESFALAGLLQHTAEQDISKVPWIGDIPILGALFRSNRFQRNETELVIIVTPYLVNPVATRLAAPTDGLIHPSDPSQVFFNDTYRQGLPAPARGPLNAGGGGLIGPGGFRLD